MFAHLEERRIAGVPDPAAVIDDTIGSHTGQWGRRTAAHLRHTIDRLKQEQPSAQLIVIQGCYHAGYEPSAGTHDYDGVIDLEIVGFTWIQTERFMRESGWAAWHRTTGQGFDTEHCHAVSIGCPGPVGVYVPQQVVDYYNHALGLADAGHDPDSNALTWHPPGNAAIDATIFDYPAWLTAQEDAMPYTDWPKADQDALVRDVAEAVVQQLLDATVDPDVGWSARRAIRQAGHAPELIRELIHDIRHPAHGHGSPSNVPPDGPPQ